MPEKFNITDKELASALEISLTRVYEICNIFDANPSNDWELKENEHFVWGKKSLQQRRFSSLGAFEICKYIDAHEGKNIIRRFRRWLSQRDHRIRQMLVGKKIIEVTQSPEAIIFEGDRAYLHQKAVRQLLGTTNKKVKSAFISEQKTLNGEPLQLGVHFIQNDCQTSLNLGLDSVQKIDHIFFSGAGIARVGNHLGGTEKRYEHMLKDPYRREWCQLVAKEAPKALTEYVSEREQLPERIKKAVNKAKLSANGRCQLTGRKRGPADPFDLAVHHVFDAKNYPHLADHFENLIVIASEIHQDFHCWMGGTAVSCNVDDFEDYVTAFSTSLFPDDDGQQMSKAFKHIQRIRKRVRPLD